MQEIIIPTEQCIDAAQLIAMQNEIWSTCFKFGVIMVAIGIAIGLMIGYYRWKKHGTSG